MKKSPGWIRMGACLALCAAAGPVDRALGAEPGGKVSATLAEDLKTLQVPLKAGYAESKHPRLLFSGDDRAALQKKARDFPTFWNPVLASAKRLGTVPDAETITTGAKYWRIEQVESGALAYFVTGDKSYLDKTIAWMVPHCEAKVWGTGFRDNLDLQASWYLYHLSVAYDILHDDIPEADRKVIVAGLSAHAKALFDSFDPDSAEARKGKYNFDQNHTYIPAVALAAASLALVGEVPEAKDWLTRAYGMMRRCRYVMGDDGYYYEGYGYWSYAMHWHVRYADLISRATGEDALDLPMFRKNWEFALQLSLPGKPGAFDIHDTNRWTGDDRPAVTPTNFAILWDMAREAAKLGGKDAGADRTAADYYEARSKNEDYPAAAFLWYAPEVAATPLEKITPYHYFADHDVLTWRSGWDEGATCLLFRSGPPEGHGAAAKLELMKDWGINAGHVHPDVGAFYLYAKGAYLAVSTGYTAEKWTKDHNTLLVDGKGQGTDGTYWNDRGVPYETLNKSRITRQFLSADYGFATGDFGAAYNPGTPDVTLKRSVLITKKFLVVIDDMAAPAEHKLTWLLHADGAFKADDDGKAFVAKVGGASLAVLPAAPLEMLAESTQTMVMAGTAPGKGVKTQRGYTLSLSMKNGAKAVRLVNVLVPLGTGEFAPRIESSKLEGDGVAFDLQWRDGAVDSIHLDMSWQPAKDAAQPGSGPAVIVETKAKGKP